MDQSLVRIGRVNNLSKSLHNRIMNNHKPILTKNNRRITMRMRIVLLFRKTIIKRNNSKVSNSIKTSRMWRMSRMNSKILGKIYR
jgi:hypothetical protein